MFIYSHIVGSTFLATEALLAYFAFSSLTNFCVKPPGIDIADFHPNFPCKVSGLYNENFLNLPGIGQICNFYPMLNIAAVPILNITLRNNLLDVIPIKQYLKKKNCCLMLTQDHRNVVKGIWSIIMSVPVIAVVLYSRNVQKFVTYTGGFLGSGVMLTIPCVFVYYARKTRDSMTTIK